MTEVRMLSIASVSTSSLWVESVPCSGRLCAVVPAVKVRNSCSVVALASSEARLLTPRWLLMPVLTCLLSAREEPSACVLSEVPCKG